MHSNYQKFLLTGDFNAEVSDHHLKTLRYQRELKSLSKEKTCFKSILNPSCTFFSNFDKSKHGFIRFS